MRTHLKLGRVFGIDIGLHYSWFLIALLIVFSLAGYFRESNPGWGSGVVWSLAGLTAILFFVSLVLHELSHSLVARSRNLPVRSITLFALGGVAQIERNAINASSEFWMAIVGPITSAVIGAIALLLGRAAGWTPGVAEPTPLVAMLVWLGYINIALAVFNMIPGYPLDGGRVLRALVWWRTGDASKSTRIAARTGQAVGIIFIAWGIFRFATGAGFGGLWIALIGWFLIQVAGESYMEAGLRGVLEGIRVGDVMARDCPVVNGFSNVLNFVQEHLLHTERRCFIVEENGEATGLISADDIRRLERARWPYTTLDTIMQPIDQQAAVAPETLLTEAMEMMAQRNTNQLPVISSGHLDGVVSKRQIAHYLQTRAA